MLWFSRNAPVLTDQKRVDDLLMRGVEEVVPKELALKKLSSGERIRIYLGVDPTGARLHLGHSVPLRKLKAFSDLGHHVIFLVGSFTAMVGDPTGRDTTREALTKEQVEKNFKTYKQQASKILDFSKVEMRYNHEWLGKMQFADIMKLASHFTVQQMLERDMFKERLSWKVVCPVCGKQSNSPIQFKDQESFESAHLQNNTMTCPHCKNTIPLGKENIIPPPDSVSPNEFLYPLMQGYDSVMLDVDCEIGGNDQLFNMLAGRKLQRVFKKRDKFVLTTKLIEGTDGRKMSKSYDNCVYLDDTPSDMYGKLMSIRDELMATYFECLTDLSSEESQAILSGHPRDAKQRLALEITALYHGKDAARKAKENFMSPDEAREVVFSSGQKVRDLAEPLGISNSELRRLVEQGAISSVETGTKVESVDNILSAGTLKVGKHRFIKILIK